MGRSPEKTQFNPISKRRLRFEARVALGRSLGWPEGRPEGAGTRGAQDQTKQQQAHFETGQDSLLTQQGEGGHDKPESDQQTNDTGSNFQISFHVFIDCSQDCW